MPRKGMSMREISVFDIIGPIMIGPSSSHTAGALKIAHVAWLMAKSKIVDVHFKLFGSFAKTYRGHGTDRALVGGMLGFATDDYRIRDSFAIAEEVGMHFSFEECDDETDYHPNTVRITLTEEDGTVSTLRGSSVGGGEIEIGEINGCEIKFSGKNNAVIVHQKDKPGVVATIAQVFAKENVNISSMNVICEDKGRTAFSVVEIDGVLHEDAVDEIRASENILSAMYIRVK